MPYMSNAVRNIFPARTIMPHTEMIIKIIVAMISHGSAASLLMRRIIINGVMGGTKDNILVMSAVGLDIK